MYFCVVLCIVCFVTFPVFVCICVLNNCHRVATKLQLNISYHISYTEELVLNILATCASGMTKTIPDVEIGRWVGKNVKCTLVQTLRLCTRCMAHRESRRIALLFHDHGTRRGWGVSVTPHPLFTPGKDPVPIVQETGWAPGPVWTGVENLAPTAVWSPDRPARSQSPYWLSYRPTGR
jgi:hypothetical protein